MGIRGRNEAAVSASIRYVPSFGDETLFKGGGVVTPQNFN